MSKETDNLPMKNEKKVLKNTPPIKKNAIWKPSDNFWMTRAERPAHYHQNKSTSLRSFKNFAEYDELTDSQLKQLDEIDKNLSQKHLPSFLEIKECRVISGCGLYATKQIPKNHVIGIYAGDVVTDKETGENNRYIFDLFKKYVIDAESCGNYTRCINHAAQTDANCIAIKVRIKTYELPQIVILSVKRIKKGDQVLLNYGEKYFEFLHLKPIPLTPSM